MPRMPFHKEPDHEPIHFKILVAGGTARGKIYRGSSFSSDGVEPLCWSGDDNADSLSRLLQTMLIRLEQAGVEPALFEPPPGLDDIEGQVWIDLKVHGLFMHGMATLRDVEVFMDTHSTCLNHLMVPPGGKGYWESPRHALASAIKHRLLPWLERK